MSLLEGRVIDDLDGGVDTQKGYMSTRAGVPPVLKQFATFAQEVSFLKNRIDEIVGEGDPESSICLVARTHSLLEAYEAYL